MQGLCRNLETALQGETIIILQIMNPLQYQAWMRERERQSLIGRARETQLILEAESEARRRRIARIETELALLKTLESQQAIRRVK